jgi:endonuclease/exonuclease/phosphatase family metal-dependent hydrolase
MVDRPLRLLTLNIRMGAGSGALDRQAYDIPASPRRDAALARAIQSAGADVVALQEVRNARHARTLADRLQTGFVYAPHPASYSLDFFEWGLALLTRFEVRRRGNFALFFDPEVRAGRIGLWAEITVGEQPVAVINVHFETRRPAAQIEALQKRVAATALPLIVMGDFNLAADDPAMDPLRRTLTDTCRAAATPASREAEAVGTRAGTRRRIDAIYLAADRFRTCEAGLLAAEHRGVSDHIGYYAEVLLHPSADDGGA